MMNRKVASSLSALQMIRDSLLHNKKRILASETRLSSSKVSHLTGT